MPKQIQIQAAGTASPSTFEDIDLLHPKRMVTSIESLFAGTQPSDYALQVLSHYLRGSAASISASASYIAEPRWSISTSPFGRQFEDVLATIDSGLLGVADAQDAAQYLFQDPYPEFVPVEWVREVSGFGVREVTGFSLPWNASDEDV